MQDDVSAGFGALDERAQPCIKREEAEEAQCCARFGNEDCEGGDGRYAGAGYEGCGWQFLVVACGADEGEEVGGEE